MQKSIIQETEAREKGDPPLIMADEEEREDRSEINGPKASKEEAAAMDKVTEQSEGRELGQADTTKIKKSMAALSAQQVSAREARRARERELAAVKVAAADIELLAQEFEIDKRKAERRLRECKGDAKTAIESLLENPWVFY